MQVLREAEHNKGIDALIFDDFPNNLDVNKDTIVRPTGFVDFPQPMAPPEYKPFNYPSVIHRHCHEKTSYVSNDTFFTLWHEWVDRG